VLWLAAWGFIICACLFFVYWIFAWGVANGQDVINVWGSGYGMALVQGLLVSEMLTIFFNNVILM
jgi:hypothetical protein